MLTNVLTPLGYRAIYLSKPWMNVKAGALAVVYHCCLNVTAVSRDVMSLEYMAQKHVWADRVHSR